MKLNKKVLFIAFLVILSTFPIFIYKDIMLGHDTLFHLSRIMGISENIEIGKIIPVYFNYLNNFGYGNGLFYPDIFLYIPVLLKKIGFNLSYAYNLFLLMINFCTVISIYICIKKITNNQRATYLGTILYTLSIYRYTDMFERSALGETIAFIFIPLIILGLYKIFYDNPKEGHYLCIGLIGILFSHVISSYILIIFTVIVILINCKKLKQKEILKELVTNLFIAVLVTSVFWAPLMEQILTSKFNIYANKELFDNILPIIPVFIEYTSYFYENIWYPNGIGLLYYLVYFYNLKKTKNDAFLKLLKTSIIIIILIIISKFIWKIKLFESIMGVIQFPWRLYMLLQILIVIYISIVLKDNKKMSKFIVIYTIIIFSFNIFLSLFNVVVNGIDDYVIMYGEYLPAGFDREIIETYDNENIEYIRKNEKTIINIINSKDKQEIPLIYYKGYVAKENGKKYKVEKSENGLVQVTTDQKAKEITVYYEGTTISKLSRLTTLIGIVLYVVWRKKQ